MQRFKPDKSQLEDWIKAGISLRKISKITGYSVKTVSDPQNNIKCGLDILQEILKADEGDYRSNGLLYGKKNNSYWEQLRRQNGGKIGELIRTHPLCARN